MIKPKRLKKGDKVAILCLSNGLLGMPFIKHELDLGLKRLEEFGLIPVIMNNSLKDMDTLRNHPELRAKDLKEAFLSDDIKGIICAIGGDDTYKTIPYLMEDKEFIEAVRKNPKLFTGFSDTTNNHLMLNKIGLNTFYGPCFSRREKEEEHGFELLNGSGVVTGRLYGGCLESLYDAYTSERHGDEREIYDKYNILPSLEEWSEKILFIETSEEKMTPEKLEIVLNFFKKEKILQTVKGIIVGKPIDEVYYEEYKNVYKKVFEDIDTPVLYNINYGHSYPRCIIPYNINATVDYDNKKILIKERIFSD